MKSYRGIFEQEAHLPQR